MNQDQDFIHQKTAVVLDTRVLAKRCLDLEKEIEEWRERCNELASEVKRVQDGHESQNHLIEFAARELKQMKQRIHANLRAVQHHTADQDRLHYLQSKTDDEYTTPQEIARIHQTLEDEVRHLYPSKAVSKLTRISPQSTRHDSTPSYRFAESNS